MSTHDSDSKSVAQAAAQLYYNEGLAQTDQVLMRRLGLAQEQLHRPSCSNLNKAAAFWFASQKMYLEAQQFLKAADQTRLGHAYIKGALDLAQRSRRLLENDSIDAPVLSKISSLILKCKSVLSQQTSQEADASEFTKTEPILGQISNTFADESALKQFLKSRQAIVQSKLQFLPDDKLVNILGFEAQDNFSLEAEHQQILQRFVNLQTLFSSLEQVTGSDSLNIAFNFLEVELERMMKADFNAAKGFLKDGMFVAIHLLYLRLMEKRRHIVDGQRVRLYQEGINRALHICVACCRLGFAQDGSQGLIVLTQTSRAYFIGQAFLLSVQYELDIVQMLVDSMVDCAVDYPVIIALPSGFRLLISMPESTQIAQVNLDRNTAKNIVARLPLLLLETFEVPQNRQALKLLQLKEFHKTLVKAPTLEVANISAFLLFSTLCELGYDWPEMYPTIAGIKSVFRRKNLKLNWHENILPYWTLRLRTEPGNPWQNGPFPNQDQIRKLLKRFDF